jgi:glycerol-3-phosphate dehydrogenase
MDRANILAALTQPLDVLVIGGGIVGAGVARDAALRGMRVGLVEARDFAFGTSSRSSRLLHGGIRYLAQGRVGLVREASVEKAILHRIAPHLAEPLAFCFPAYRGSGWPLWQLRIGVKIYDRLCGGTNLGASEGLNVADVKKICPGLKREGLRGAVKYFDGFTNDARLVIDTLRSAENASAAVANYVRFTGVEQRDGHMLCTVSDEVTNADFTIRARSVVNATGPWAENVGLSAVMLSLTKGIHLVFDRARLQTNGAVVITEGRRVLFVLPWGERTIVGTTDTSFFGRPEDVRVEADDVAYLLGTVNEFFPAAKLSSSDVLSSWAGVRPLIFDAKGPSDISRAHLIRNIEPGWWDVAGGKLTTYRLMAEQTVDRIVKSTGASFGKSTTASTPMLDECDTRGISQILPPPVSRALIEHFCKNEWARNLDDVMTRRTSWKYYLHDADQTARAVAQCMSEILGWPKSELQAQLARYFS